MSFPQIIDWYFLRNKSCGKYLYSMYKYSPIVSKSTTCHAYNYNKITKIHSSYAYEPWSVTHNNNNNNNNTIYARIYKQMNWNYYVVISSLFFFAK